MEDLSDNCEIVSHFALGSAVHWMGHCCPLADTIVLFVRREWHNQIEWTILAVTLQQYWHGFPDGMGGAS
jgi:hypothetical protein